MGKLRRAVRATAPTAVRSAYADWLGGRASQRIDEIRTSSRPVVAGPWLSELGFELLYWIPFLRWLTTEGGVSPERVTVVSRGGADPWYADVARRYVDVLDRATPDDVRDWQKRRLRALGTEKHVGVAEIDRQIVISAAGADLQNSEWIHPSLMYRLFNPHWTWGRSSDVVDAHTRPEPLPRPEQAAPEVLRPYVAVKAYFSRAFPKVRENQALVQRLLEQLAERTTVVVLADPGIGGHVAYQPASGSDRIVVPALEPRSNLAEQARLVQGAEALVGTYGGFSYLGPFVATPTVAFYSEDRFNRTHLDAMRRAAEALGLGPSAFDVRHVDDVSADVLSFARRESA